VFLSKSKGMVIEMKKSKFYLLFALLTVMLLFSVSALCNMCGTTPATTDTAAGGTNTGKTDVEKDGGTTTSATTDKTEETTDKTDKTSATQDTSDYEAPTIKLEIYEGPTYSAGDDICYYRIKATVTGKPAPTVKFSKDDSNGNQGTKKAQVNIHRGETYILKATAKNSEGEDSDSMTLTWGCNSNPVISDITLSSATFVINKTYDITASASDPDGDSLTYKWTVSSGAINNGTANPMKWTTPGTAGDCTITVLVTDGKGGEATKSKTISVGLPVPVNMTVSKVASEGGYIAYGGVPINAGGCLFAGDAPNNNWVVGYISFDISSLAHATIQNASLGFNRKNPYGDWSFFSSFCVYDTYWGTVPISTSTYSLPGEAIEYINSATSGNFVVNNPTLRTKLQAAIDAGHPRFQIGISPQGASTDSNGDWDGIEWDQSGVVLNITYLPGS